MFKMRHAKKADKMFWLTLDKHIGKDELLLKIRNKRAYIMFDGNKPIGVMRYNLFWDEIPFLTFIYIKENYQGHGFGKKAMLLWEREMRKQEYKMVMTSTQVDEQVQHFYRKLGYIDKGSLFFDNTVLEQPQELLMLKEL